MPSLFQLDLYCLTDGCAAESKEEHFAAIKGSIPLISTPVTCSQASILVRNFMEEGIHPKKLPNYVETRTNSGKRKSLARCNANGERRVTFLHEARHSAYLKYDFGTDRQRLSIATLLHYYPEKEETDNDGFDVSRLNLSVIHCEFFTSLF